MMTKEEVAQVIAYCDENKISYKQRLAKLKEIASQILGEIALGKEA